MPKQSGSALPYGDSQSKGRQRATPRQRKRAPTCAVGERLVQFASVLTTARTRDRDPVYIHEEQGEFYYAFEETFSNNHGYRTRLLIHLSNLLAFGPSTYHLVRATQRERGCGYS